MSTADQYALAEADPWVLPGAALDMRTNAGTLDFQGPYGVYYREIFAYVPHLIANALTSRGQFRMAQDFYHYLFDPSSTDASNIDTKGLTPPAQARRLLDRVWRYRDFRGKDPDTLRDILTNSNALALYKKEPFNPWAIGRQRFSAYPKAVVMQYVTNLLDWGDFLFRQFTMESVNEAFMLYTTASEIFGTRPAELGDCGNEQAPSTYADISSAVQKNGGVLIEELESWTIGANVADLATASDASEVFTYAPAPISIARATSKNAMSPIPSAPRSPTIGGNQVPSTPGPSAEVSPSLGDGNLFQGLGGVRTRSWGPPLGGAKTRSPDKIGGQIQVNGLERDEGQWVGRYAGHVVRQMPLFCVPPNPDLVAIWDRIDDRLYKIRHCMDLDGNKHELALFAPPIDPRQLIAMKAAGLSLDDVMAVGNGNLPPYRFLYLIERAKAFASTLSNFGTAFLSTLEKKDGEQLARLHLTQQMNLAQLTSHSQQLEIDAASATLESLNRQNDVVQYRFDYYTGLVTDGRNTWETMESVARHTASAIYGFEPALNILSAVSALIPQIGSPFAMTYGGVQLNSNIKSFADAQKAVATVAESIAGSASLEASFERRSDEWNNQGTLATKELKVLDRQIAAATIRLDIATRAFEMHQTSITQIQEQLDFSTSKFTDLGLYTSLSAKMHVLLQTACRSAMSMANLAMQAYRFERGDDSRPSLAASYWDPTIGGLLSGERLLMDLQMLEQRFIESNYRTPEVEQSFSLVQLDPQALINLRETGDCIFKIDEVFFDLFYPGHYKRRIKCVRLTIPCVTGPYTNVSATLELQASWVRMTPDPKVSPVSVPPTRSVSIASSTGINDVGVFEFSYRDERYMPFEGLGAVSQWRLSLPSPKAFPQFDYHTITDVVLSVSYVADADGQLRDIVESQSASQSASLLAHFSTTPLGRAFSLRYDFPSVYAALLGGPLGAIVNVEITNNHLPFFVGSRQVKVTNAVLLLRPADGVDLTGVQLSVGGATTTGFSSAQAVPPILGNLPGASVLSSLGSALRGKHALAVTNAGALAPSPASAGAAAIDASKLRDIVLYVEYTLAAAA